MRSFRLCTRDLASVLLLLSPLMAVQVQLLQSHFYYYENQSGWDGVTHKAIMAANLTGRYYAFPIETHGHPDMVFMLIVKSQSLDLDIPVRLILYCRNGTLSWSPTKNLGTQGNRTTNGLETSMLVDSGYEFCNNSAEVPISNGAQITVIGTEIFPSQWQPYISTPDFDFYADLYAVTVIA